MKPASELDSKHYSHFGCRSVQAIHTVPTAGFANGCRIAKGEATPTVQAIHYPPKH